MATLSNSSTDADIATLFGMAPAIGSSFATYYNRLMAESELPTVAVELCRLRLAHLLGCNRAADARSQAAVANGLTKEKVAALADWPSSSLFDDLDRACLNWAEQFVLDPNGVTDEDSDAVRSHLGNAGLVAFDLAIGIQEALLRAMLVLGSGPSVDDDASELRVSTS